MSDMGMRKTGGECCDLAWYLVRFCPDITAISHLMGSTATSQLQLTFFITRYSGSTDPAKALSQFLSS